MKTKTFHKLYTTVIWLLLAVVSTNCTETFDEPDLPTDIETRSGWDPGMTKKYFRLENIVSYIKISSNDVLVMNDQLISLCNGEGYFSPLQPGERIDSPLQAAFHYWLDAIITNNGKYSFPSIEKVLTTTYNGYGYYDMLEEFILRNPAYNYPIDYTLEPELIGYLYENIN